MLLVDMLDELEQDSDPGDRVVCDAGYGAWYDYSLDAFQLLLGGVLEVEHIVGVPSLDVGARRS